MPKLSPATELARHIQKLRAEYNETKARLTELEELFGQLGITVDSAARKPGRPRGSGSALKVAKGGRRKRGSFAVTGEASVLAFIEKQGQPNAAEVNKHWSGEGRGGKADNTLTRLVKEGKLKRVEVKGERGSRYKLA